MALLRKARDLGVTTFDVADARFPERAERMLATAFPDRDPGLSVIVGRSVEGLTRERTPQGDPTGATDLEDAITRSLERSRQRLEPVRISIVEWTPEDDSTPEPSSVAPALPIGMERGADVRWALRLPPSPSDLPSLTPPASLFSGELSLLHPDLIARFERDTLSDQPRLIARDPFSSGRLDGTRFARTGSVNGPGMAPVDVRRLHEEFDPILRLGFLTAGHRRTLAQAALQFVLAQPWVATAVIPLPDPERFDEVLGYGSCPPLSSDDLSQLAHIK